MAVKLRLRRMGRKKQPSYRIVAADSRFPRDGRFIEQLGYYNPLTDPLTLEVKEERVLYWLQQGAIPTTTVKSLLRKKGIIYRMELMKRGLPREKIEEEMKKWEVLQLEKIKRRLAQKAEAKKPEKPAEKEAEVKVGEPGAIPAEKPAAQETQEPAAKEQTSAEESATTEESVAEPEKQPSDAADTKPDESSEAEEGKKE